MNRQTIEAIRLELDLFVPFDDGKALDAAVAKIVAAIEQAKTQSYAVRRGETWHGIAKRLSGDADPGSLLVRVQRLREVNASVPGISAPPVGTSLNVPSEWVWASDCGLAMPPVRDVERIEVLAVTELEAERRRHARTMVDAKEWRAIARMPRWPFFRWALRYLFFKQSIVVAKCPHEIDWDECPMCSH